jgi:hypothetical protein
MDHLKNATVMYIINIINFKIILSFCKIKLDPSTLSFASFTRLLGLC